MKLVELAVKRPIATGVIYAFICLAGFFAWTKLPQELMPDLQYPQLTIVTGYSQASPQEIENLITKPIEEAVGTVKNVARIKSISREGVSLVTVEFAWGTNMDFASLNTREKLDLVKSRLPSEVREPTVVKYNPFHTPILILSLAAKQENDPEYLSHIAQKTIANRLQKVEGVAAVQVSGAREKEIQVNLDQARLAASRISVVQFNQAIARANYKGAAGTAKEGSYDYAVRVVAPFDTAEDIRNTVISIDNPAAPRQEEKQGTASGDRLRRRAVQADQRLIPVSQLGTVSEGLKERSSFSRYDGEENITLMIQKQASASTLATARKLRSTIREIQDLLPSDVSLSIIYDQAVLIRDGIWSVLFSIFGGGILAFLVLYFALRSWRDAAIVSVVIPVSALLTIIAMTFMGLSLNTISMGGLALGIGMLVDASICVTENIHRRRTELGETEETAIIKGTTEVAGAVTSSNLTSIAVFLPLLFVLGLLGQLFRDLSLTVTISQIVSIVVSLTLVPMLAKTVGGGMVAETARAAHSESPRITRLKTWYARRLDRAFERPGRVWGGLLVALVVSLLVLKMLPLEFMPRVDANQVTAKLTMPNGTRLERTDDVARRCEAVFRDVGDLDHIATTVGSSSETGLVLLGKNEARFIIDLKKNRSRHSDRVMEDLRQRTAELDLKGGRLEIAAAGGALSAVQGAVSPFMVHLKGSDLKNLQQAAAELKSKLADVPGLVQVRDSLALPASEIHLNIDKERAARRGLTVTDIAQTAAAAYHGRNATTIYRDGKEIPVRVRLREDDRRSAAQLRGLLLTAQGGESLPLSDVASVALGEGPSQIERIDQERTVLIQADHSADYTGASRRAVETLLTAATFPGVTIEIAGEKRAQAESFRSLAFTLAVSVLLVFMVMAIQFESLLQPFLILFTIPLSLIGMATGLLVMGKTVNAVAGMGLLLLAGIVVNNGIVLIDFVNSARREKADKSLKDALREACLVRLRPILLTAATTIVGLIPLALGVGEGAELQSPMAVTVIFGLAAATVLTLVALPTLFCAVEEGHLAASISASAKRGVEAVSPMLRKAARLAPRRTAASGAPRIEETP